MGNAVTPPARTEPPHTRLRERREKSSTCRAVLYIRARRTRTAFRYLRTHGITKLSWSRHDNVQTAASRGDMVICEALVPRAQIDYLWRRGSAEQGHWLDSFSVYLK